MHSSQYIALARHFDNEGCTIAAMHHMPGATPGMDGAALVLYNEDVDATRTLPDAEPCGYCMVTVHVGMPSTLNERDPRIEELTAGKRHWKTEREALSDFMDMVDHDLVGRYG